MSNANSDTPQGVTPTDPASRHGFVLARETDTGHTPAQIAFIDGLYQLAGFLALHPEIPATYPQSIIANVNAYSEHDAPARDRLAEIARIPGGWDKRTRDDPDTFELVREFGPHKLIVFAARDAVCEKIATIEKVTHEIPDPDLLAQVPLVAVTETVERVEWSCPRSLLAEVES